MPTLTFNAATVAEICLTLEGALTSHPDDSQMTGLGVRTRLKATATGAPDLPANSAACSSAQLSRAR